MELYRKGRDIHTRWSSFENLSAAKGSAGRENRAGKGHAFDCIPADGGEHFIRLLDREDQPVDSSDPELKGKWTNFHRQDDWSATAWFYLDRPENDLPPLAPVAERIADLQADVDVGERQDT